MSKTLLWFRNDLRIHDNEALKRASESEEMIPVYCFDPRHFSETSFGFNKTGPFRTSFLIESVSDLRSNLKELGATLIVRTGKPEEVIPLMVKEYGIDTIYAHKEVTSEEVRVEDNLADSADVPIEWFYGSTLFHLDDIPYDYDSIPKVFTNFRKQVEKKSSVRDLQTPPEKLKMIEGIKPGEIPTVPELGVEPQIKDERVVLPFEGGETEALKRLQHYFWEQDRLKSYKFTRNQLLGANYSSKFSPWLANGSLSPRKIFHEVKKYEEERKKNVSTYWMVFELIWRDYFRFSAHKYGNKIFFAGGIQDKGRNWSTDRETFQQWARGETGIPFIDANMRELNQTGYMSNRGRQNVASFLAQNLNIDWRMGAEYFESLLIDYDVCSNYGNWMYNSTVGQDPRNRYFNIANQAEKYDSDGDYVRHWLPELKNVPDEHIHEPHKLSQEEQEDAGIDIGVDYSEPMIDLEASYQEIRNRE
ncbi:DASH family cryptochrome [Balneolaceae bacterium YR4-1]|uniref:Cryptochrome DASH n=1 Tax=Halalkalibaculum roseum TaxID=2709311 RepID=A0A6M1T3Y4_9BACT|nr:DASH family cryptochrome [Halalkalibaculum roseum]NGP77457.1 DASH family cryptochrome [Halalkalibaculum roseum]